MNFRTLSLLAIFFCTLAPSQASISQAWDTSWSLQDSERCGVVDLARDGNVFLWLGSRIGPNRFDGEDLKLGAFQDGGIPQTQAAKWQDASSQHDVTSATLSPNRHRLWARAGNEDDFRNRAAVAVSLFVQRTLYQTMWVRLICTIGALVLLWHVYRIRLRVTTMKVHDLMAERLMEREHVAAEIHDTLLQKVQGLILLFSGVAAQLPTDSAISDSAEAAIQRTERLLQEVRDNVCNLRRGSRDLPECFRNLRREFESSSTTYEFTQVGCQPELQLTVDDHVYELGCEAVRNAAQHAKASEVSVYLSFLPNALRMTVSDDGVGIDTDTTQRGRVGHGGLQGMTRRADKLRGNFVVQSKPGSGTIVRLSVPASTAYRKGTPTVSALLQSHWQMIRRKLSSSELS